MPTTPLHGWATPDGSEQPQVHLDMESLADAIDADTPVAATSAPPHKDGRQWYDSTNDWLFMSDGTRWTPADGRPLSQTVLTSGSAQTEAAGTETAITNLLTTFDASGTTYELEVQLGLQSSVAGDRIGVRVKRGATVVGDFVFMPAFAGVRQLFTAKSFDTPPAGSVTYQVYFLRSGGTGITQVATPATTAPNIISVRKA